MSHIQEPASHALNGPVLITFFRYFIPSIVGMLAMTSANLIDGMFIGNLVGVRALASVNLTIPFLALLFGVGLMLSVGGSVRGGKYLGEKNIAAASAIFSKTFICVAAYGALVITIGLVFENQVFRALGAQESLFALMSDYYRIVLPFIFFQLGTIVLYFFIRLDGFPTLSAIALVVGSVLNIIMDYIFIAHFQWGLKGAAFATGLSQLLPFIVLMLYFLHKKRKLHFQFKQKNWSEVLHAAYNGISDFINEISAGIITFVFNWMLIRRAGVEGVAAITVMNYLLMLGYTVFFAVSDSTQVMISQNYGAKDAARMLRFLAVAAVNIGVVSLVCIFILTSQSEALIWVFLADNGSDSTVKLAVQFVYYIWPVFLFVGLNMLISSYLTAIHLPFQSGVVSLCRSLILPTSLLLVLYFIFDDYRFVLALPIAEAFTLALALFFFIRHEPHKAIADRSNH